MKRQFGEKKSADPEKVFKLLLLVLTKNSQTFLFSAIKVISEGFEEFLQIRKWIVTKFCNSQLCLCGLVRFTCLKFCRKKIITNVLAKILLQDYSFKLILILKDPLKKKFIFLFVFQLSFRPL